MSNGAATDTHPTNEPFIIEGHRRMSVAQKIARVTELTPTIPRLALADTRRRYPVAAAEESSLRLASRWLGPELMRNAFNWNVDMER